MSSSKAWLSCTLAGKIFLDWRDGSLWALVASQIILWWVLAVSLKKRKHEWSRSRIYSSLLGLAVLAVVPVSLIYASSPALYPPIDCTTGGPLGSSLLGSALVVVGLMLMLPRVVAVRTRQGRTPGIWLYFRARGGYRAVHISVVTSNSRNV